MIEQATAGDKQALETVVLSIQDLVFNLSLLSQAAGTAQTIHGAIQTGKAISAAAKGAAVGGPYGAAAGLAFAAGQHGKQLLAAVAVLLLLPVMFILMLPGLMFGGFTKNFQSPCHTPVSRLSNKL